MGILSQPYDREAGIARRKEREALEKKARDNLCAACGTALDVAHDPERGAVLRCGRCGVTDPDTRHRYEPSLRQRYQRAGSMDKAGFSAIDRMMWWRQLQKAISWAEAEGRELDAERDKALLMKVEAEMQGQSLTVFQPAAVVSQEEAHAQSLRFLAVNRIATSKDLALALEETIQRTGLSPILGELSIYENAVYVTDKGLRALLNASPVYEGEEAPKVLSVQESVAKGYREDEIVTQLLLYRKGRRGVIIGEGKTSRLPANAFRNSQFEIKWPVRCSEVRAFRQAFNKGFRDLLSAAGVQMLPVEIAEGMTPGSAPVVTDAIDGDYRDAADDDFNDGASPINVFTPGATREPHPLSAEAGQGPLWPPTDDDGESEASAPAKPPTASVVQWQAFLAGLSGVNRAKWSEKVIKDYGGAFETLDEAMQIDIMAAIEKQRQQERAKAAL